MDHRPDIIVYPLNQAKVYLTTTMYREHPKIMEQYLRCLSRVCSSQQKYQSLETHIVFDDAFVLGKRFLNEHAQTFIALCKDILKESDADTAKMVDMPYGSQIIITLQDGIHVYVHFKNSEKVKKYSTFIIRPLFLDRYHHCCRRHHSYDHYHRHHHHHHHHFIFITIVILIIKFHWLLQ